MERGWIISAALAAAMLPLSASGGGVPTVDVSAVVMYGQSKSVEDAKQNALAEKTTKETTLDELHQQQLDELDATLSRLTGVTMVADDLENLSGLEAADVYAIEDDNPYAERLFGGASPTIEQMIVEVAQKYAGHAALAKAGINAVEWRCWFQGLVKQESNFSIGARSPVGAFGLTQIMPDTAKGLGIYPGYYDDPKLQLEGGAKYLLQQLNKFGSMDLALAAYNAGPGNVSKYGGIPPFKETQNYVVRIRGYYNTYASKVSGADTLGTLDPSDTRIAEASNMSDAGLHYAEFANTKMVESVKRLRAISAQIETDGGSDDPARAKRAMDLNTYARIEVARIGFMLVRAKAAHAKVEQARYAMLYAAYAVDVSFLKVKD